MTKKIAEGKNDEEAMLQITKGTNNEGLTSMDAYLLDDRIFQAVGRAIALGLDYDRFLELIEAAWDMRLWQIEEEATQVDQRK
jgi:hypothetical protein